MGEGPEHARAGYRDNYPRLAEIKSAYEPRQRLPHQPEHHAARAAIQSRHNQPGGQQCH